MSVVGLFLYVPISLVLSGFSSPMSFPLLLPAATAWGWLLR